MSQKKKKNEKNKVPRVTEIAHSLRSVHSVHFVLQFSLIFDIWLEENASGLELNDLSRVLLHSGSHYIFGNLVPYFTFLFAKKRK